MSTHSLPSRRSRFLAFIVGPGYLFLVACVLASATQTPFAIVFALTLLAAVIVMAALAVLGVKAYQYKQSAARFTLSTAFVVSIPLCIYLAAMRWVLQSLPVPELDALAWIPIAAFGTLWMAITTIVLLCLAEAIVWLAVALFRGLSSRWTPDRPLRARNTCDTATGEGR